MGLFQKLFGGPGSQAPVSRDVKFMLAASMRTKALDFLDREKLDKGLTYFKEQERICRQLYDAFYNDPQTNANERSKERFTLALCLSDQARTLGMMRRSEEAIPLAMEALELAVANGDAELIEHTRKVLELAFEGARFEMRKK